MDIAIKRPQIIVNASEGTMSSRKLMDGLVESSLMTGFQRQAIDGIIPSAMPQAGRPTGGHQLNKVKPYATQQKPGTIHFGGSKFE